MRTRTIIGGLLITSTAALAAPALAGPAVAAPALATSTGSRSALPPACVVVNGPSGLSVEAGYAPNGPSDCHTVP